MEKISGELKSHFLNLYYIALSDTQIDTKELDYLYRFGEARGVTRSEIESIILNPDSVKFQIPQITITKIEYLYDFACMIWADGKVDDNERHALKMFCKKFEFEDENIDELTEYLIEQAHNKIPKHDFLKIVTENL
jgi:hypothetical protein